jgi:hypothetical protein
MLAVFRRQRLRPLLTVAALVPALAVPACVAYAHTGRLGDPARARDAWALFAGACLLAAGVLVGRPVLNARADPNRDGRRYRLRTGLPGPYAAAGPDPAAVALERVTDAEAVDE